MTGPECKIDAFNHQPGSVEANFLQSLEALSEKLPDGTTESPLQINIGRSIFEENNVNSGICNVLFDDKTNINFKLSIASSGLNIEAFNMKEGSEDKKASMRLCLSKGRLLHYLFVIKRKYIELVPKGVNIKPADYLNILGAFKSAATEQGLTK